MNNNTNIRKILNDPVHGFITIQGNILLNIINHSYFQRMRRIKQLGLTHLVYPGSLHTRFSHAIGSMHLMQKAIGTLRLKGHEITDQEYLAANIAILLHDIGHGPFSHALEDTIVNEFTHEEMSLMFMNYLNVEFDGLLSDAIKIFNNNYHKTFLHQLVSSQLDVDRLDYLKRDSFYTGVSEGIISTERIITMMNVFDNELVIEEKGIYSIEKFIVARRLMYWQVYLHKTVLSAKQLIVKILTRAKYLAHNNVELFGTKALKHFLYNEFNKTDFADNKNLLDNFSQLDDNDIIASIKTWTSHNDNILAILCQKLIDRKLNRVEIKNNAFDKDYVEQLKINFAKQSGIDIKDTEYFISTGTISNNAYDASLCSINVLNKQGEINDITVISDKHNLSALSEPVTKHFLYCPKEVTLVNN